MKKKSLFLFLLPFILIIISVISVNGIDQSARYKTYTADDVVDSKQANEQYAKSYTLEYDLLRFAYAIDYNSKYDVNQTSEQNLRNIYGKDLTSYTISQVTNFLTQADSDLQYNYSFLKYHLVNKEDNSTYGNQNNIELTKSDSYTYELTFDEHGNISIDGNTHFDIPIKTAYASLIRNNLEVTLSSGNKENATIIKNCVITFEIPKSTNIVTANSYSNNGTLSYTDYSTHVNAVLISFLVVGIISLFLPVKRLREFTFYRNLIDMPLEIGFFVSISFFTLSARIIMDNFLFEGTASFVMYSILMFIFIIDVLIFKYFLSYPPAKYLKEKTLTAMGVQFFTENIKQFDLSDRYNSTLIKIILANAAAILILPMWIGLTGLIIYCVILFILLINFANRVKDDYQSLLEVTSSIASGKFDKTSNTDLGIFNSYRDSMDTIRDDFKNAVENEIRSEKMKTELITSVSHDLKTPLTSIVTYADLLKDENLNNDKKKEYIDVIDRNALRLKNLINDLFEVSKATSGNITLNLMDIDLISLIKQALLEYDHLFEKNGLDIKFNTNIDKAILRLDSQKTYRIITNLLVNISKYAMENTRVYIDVVDIDNNIQITLKNISRYEIQIAPSELLERFVQGDSSRHTEGSGLGLAITKTFTELQGGTCQVAVDGDLFKVTLTFPK